MTKKFIYINKILAVLPIVFISSIVFYLYINRASADNLTLLVSPEYLVGQDCIDAGGGTGDSCYTSIQAAVDVARVSNGTNTIFVQSGTGTTPRIFRENIEIRNRPISSELFITKSGTGEVIIDGDNAGSTGIVFDIYAENVQISGFTIQTNTPDNPAIYIRPDTFSVSGEDIVIKNNVLINQSADSIYITDVNCTTDNCKNRIYLEDNFIYAADGMVSTYIQYVHGAVIQNNLFTKFKNGVSSKGITIHDSDNIEISDNEFTDFYSDNPSDVSFGIQLISNSFGGKKEAGAIPSTVYNISISNNIFESISGLQSAAIALNNLSSTSVIGNSIEIKDNDFSSDIVYAITARDNTGKAPEVEIDATSNTFKGVSSPQGRENKITHNCMKAKETFAGHQNLTCDLPDNEKGSDFLLVNHTDVAVPLFLGWNKGAESPGAPGEEPVDVEYDPEESFVTNEAQVAFVWQSVSGSDVMKYEYKITSPSGALPNFVRSESNSGFIDLNNEIGTWKAQVRAFIDSKIPPNSSWDEGEAVSDWSDPYSFTYDGTAPSIDSAPSNVVYNEGDAVSDLAVTVSDSGGLNSFCYTVEKPNGTLYEEDYCLPLDGTNDTVKILADEFTGQLDTREFEEGDWEISYWVSDVLGNTTDKVSFTITIDNVVPVINSSFDTTPVLEGEEIPLHLSFTDPGLDDADWAVDINYGDGNSDEFTVGSDGVVTLPNPTYAYVNEGTYTITVSVSESNIDGGDGQVATLTQNIEVLNNVPEVEILVNGTNFIEGNTITFTANITGGNPAFTYEWGDNCSNYSNGSFNFATNGNTYAVEGSYICSLSVVDIDGDRVDAGSVTFSVANNKPTVHISTTPSSEVNEGTVVTLTAQIDHGNGPFTYTWGECSTNNQSSITLNNQGEYTCNLGVTDADGDVAVANAVVKINNFAPEVTISANPGTTVNAGTAALLTANVTGGNAPYSYLWTGACNTTAAISYAPYTAGTHICNLKVTDVDGDFDETYITITVNSVPGGGTVLGTGSSGTTNKQNSYYTSGSNNNVLAESDENAEESEDDTSSGTIIPTPTIRPQENQVDEMELLSCKKKIKVSGYVYFDTDDNGRNTSADDGVEGVSVYLELESSSGTKPLTNVKTDNKGYWEDEVCPAKELLVVRLDSSTLPGGSKIKDAENVRVNIFTSSDKQNLNFILVKSAKFTFFLLFLLLIIFAVLLYLGWRYYKKKHPYQKFDIKLFLNDMKELFLNTKKMFLSRIKGERY